MITHEDEDLEETAVPSIWGPKALPSASPSLINDFHLIRNLPL